MTINLKDIENVCIKFNNDIATIALEIKRIQSLKCRLKKHKGKSTYQSEMSNALAYEQVLKEALGTLKPKDKFVTSYTQEDIDILSYDETCKAIRSIQSKKSLSKWLTDVECGSQEYKDACTIENMLLEHRQKVLPIEESVVKKTEVSTIIDILESNGKMSKDMIIDALKKLL